MRNLIYGLLSIGFLLISCNKEEDAPDGPPSVQIEEYLEANGIVGETTTSSGLVYIIEEPGGTEKPTQNSSITINYKGYLTNGVVFDETTGTPRTFPLRNLILAWQEAIPLIGRGGKIKILAPPSIAYGNNPPRGSVITANSVLVFDIELIDF